MMPENNRDTIQSFVSCNEINELSSYMTYPMCWEKRNMCLMRYGVEVISQDRINIFDYANVMDWNVGFYEDSNYWRHLFKDVGGDLGRCSAGKLATDSVMGAPEGHLPFVFLCIFRWTTFLYPPFFLPLTLRLLLLGFFLGEILPLSLL